MAKLKGLGRGLDALLSTVDTVDDRLSTLPIDSIRPGKYQPRSFMDEAALDELAASIRVQGIIQPLIVRELGLGDYELIAGERRWRASRKAGLTEVPVVIKSVPDEAALAMALIENIQREDLNPLEEARALERLISEFGVTHQQAADAVGRSRSAVSNLLRLLELAPEVCGLIENRQLEMGHAKALAALPNRQQQAEIGAAVARKGLSVRDTEAWVRRIQSGSRAGGLGADAPASSRADPNVSRLENELADKLGAKVAIQHSSSGRGKLIVSYHSLDELDGILAHIR